MTFYHSYRVICKASGGGYNARVPQNPHHQLYMYLFCTLGHIFVAGGHQYHTRALAFASLGWQQLGAVYQVGGK